METGGAGFSAGAAEHAWRPSPSPWPPSSPALRERKGEGATGSERIVVTFHTMVAWSQYEPCEKCEFLIML